MRRKWSFAPLALLALMVLVSPLRADQDSARKPLTEQVRHELATLPFYSVFDDLNFQVNGDTVTLTGYVTRPTLKSDAEAAAKRIESVSKVNNEIVVLPLSSFDNRIRRAAYFTLFNYNSPLFRYALGSNPSIHIIVENGHVTLTGFVSSQADKNIAEAYLKGVSGVFSVTNNLQVG